MRKIGLLAASVCLISSVASSHAQETREIVLARVNSRLITREDVKKLLIITGELDRIKAVS